MFEPLKQDFMRLTDGGPGTWLTSDPVELRTTCSDPCDLGLQLWSNSLINVVLLWSWKPSESSRFRLHLHQTISCSIRAARRRVCFTASRLHTAHIVLSRASFEWREWKAAPQFPWSDYTQEVSGVTEESCPLTKTHLLVIKSDCRPATTPTNKERTQIH